MKIPISLSIVIAIAALTTRAAKAQATEFVDFINGNWDHGGTMSPGWNSSELEGIYTMADGNRVTMSVSFYGTAIPTVDNLSVINESYFTGFAFQMIPDTNDNPSGGFLNYERIDFRFERAVTIDEFVLTDVDRSSWDDVIFAEAWAGGGPVGTPGTGTVANYGFRSPTNLGLEQIGGLSQVVVLSGDNTVNGPESDLFIDFGQPVNAFSIYYSNGDWANSAATQTIGLRGSGFTVTTVPEPAVAVFLGLAAALSIATRRRPNGGTQAVAPLC